MVRKNIKLTDDELQKINTAMNNLEISKFTDFVRYAANYFSSQLESKNYERKIIQSVDRNVEFTKVALLECLKVIAASKEKELDETYKKVEEGFERKMESHLIEKAYRKF